MAASHEEDRTEEQIDTREAFFSDPATIDAYAAAGMELPSEEEISTMPAPEPPPPPYNIKERNAERLAKVQELTRIRNARSAALAQQEQQATLPGNKEKQEDSATLIKLQ